jgi:hypothetical protein
MLVDATYIYIPVYANTIEIGRERERKDAECPSSVL